MGGGSGRGKRSSELGRWGEDLLCKILGYKRQPGSGSQWPKSQDLVREIPGLSRSQARRLAVQHGFGTEDAIYREVAQVKATEAREFLDGYEKLVKYAEAERALPHWYIVVKTPQRAHIFEVVPIKEVLLGLGGDF